MNHIMILSMFLALTAAPSYAADWSPWAQLDDGVRNGIEFSQQNDCPAGKPDACKLRWRFNNNYGEPVNLEYTLSWETGKGIKNKKALIKLKTGENEDPSFTVTGRALDEVGVTIKAAPTATDPVAAAEWSPWSQLDDGALNGIEFSYISTCPAGKPDACSLRWRFRSGYDDPVNVEYTLNWLTKKGLQKKIAKVKLQPGENSPAAFNVTGQALDEISVRIIADARTLADAREAVAQETLARVTAAKEGEEKQRRQQKIAEATKRQNQRRAEERAEEERKRLEEEERQRLAEEKARIAAEKARQEEEERLDREERDRQEEQEREERQIAAERREREKQEAREENQRQEQAEISQSWNNNYMDIRNKLMNDNRETLGALQRERQQIDNIQREKEERKREAEADRRRAERQAREAREDRERRERKEEENRKQASLKKQRNEQERASRVQKEKEQVAVQQEKDRQEKTRLAKLEEERLIKERAEKERREKEQLERERAKAEERAKQEKERLAAQVAEKAAKQAYLAKIASGARLQARTCPGGEGKYYLTGTYPQVANRPVACVDISYRATCPGDVVGITGVATSFTGISKSCYMGDTVVLEPKPGCPVDKVRIKVLGVTPCR